MAIVPSGAIAIKDDTLQGGSTSIALEVDGNTTGDKHLATLGATAGLDAGGTSMSEFYSYSAPSSFDHQIIPITGEDNVGCNVFISIPPINIWSADEILDCNSSMWLNESLTTPVADDVYVIGNIGDESDPIADFTWLETESGNPGDCDYCP